MTVTAFVCPSCGAALEDADDKDFCFCEYCGTKVINPGQNIEATQSAPLFGSAEEVSLLERAFMFIEDGAFLDADKYLERVLDHNPKCAKAYMGKLLCSLHFKNIEQLRSSRLPLTNYVFYKKALKFASSGQAAEYQKIDAAITEKYEREKERIESEISAVRENILTEQQYLTEHKSNYNKAVAKKILWNTLAFLSTLSVAFFTVGTIVSLPIAAIDIPCIVWMIFMIRKASKIRKSTAEYNKIKLQLQQNNHLLAIKQHELARFIS